MKENKKWWWEEKTKDKRKGKEREQRRKRQERNMVMKVDKEEWEKINQRQSEMMSRWKNEK